MSFSESVLVALFTWVVVFAVLAVLFLIIQVFSKVVVFFQKPKVAIVAGSDGPTAVFVASKPNDATHKLQDNDFSAGAIKLRDVDEQTAAMIMAIVSDESGTPLSELCFKSIKLVNGDKK